MQSFIPTFACYCGLILSSSTMYAIDWDKIATALGCGVIMLTFGEINRYRERTHKQENQQDKMRKEALLQRAEERKEYRTAVKALNACIEQQKIVEMYYRENTALHEQARRCIEHASYHVGESFLMRAAKNE